MATRRAIAQMRLEIEQGKSPILTELVIGSSWGITVIEAEYAKLLFREGIEKVKMCSSVVMGGDNTEPMSTPLLSNMTIEKPGSVFMKALGEVSTLTELFISGFVNVLYLSQALLRSPLFTSLQKLHIGESLISRPHTYYKMKHLATCLKYRNATSTCGSLKDLVIYCDSFFHQDEQSDIFLWFFDKLGAELKILRRICYTGRFAARPLFVLNRSLDCLDDLTGINLSVNLKQLNKERTREKLFYMLRNRIKLDVRRHYDFIESPGLNPDELNYMNHIVPKWK